MEAALCDRHVEVPRAALATGAVVAATFAAAAAAWTALPGNATTSPVPVTHPVAHARAMRDMHMSGIGMPGMKMPMPPTAARR